MDDVSLICKMPVMLVRSQGRHGVEMSWRLCVG